MKKVKMVPVIFMQGNEYQTNVPLQVLKSVLKDAVSVLQLVDKNHHLEFYTSEPMQITCLESEGEILCVDTEDLEDLELVLTELETLPNEVE